MIFMGVYRGDRSGSSDDDTAEHEPAPEQTSLDEHTKTTDDDDDAAAAAAGAGAAAGATAAGAASGVGAAGATAAGGPVPTEVQDPDEPADDEKEPVGDGDVAEPCGDEEDGEPDEDATESEAEPPSEYESPQEEPPEQDQHPDDVEHEDPDVDTDDEGDEEPDESDADEEDENDDEDDEEEEESVTVTVTVDPLSAMSWGIQPVLKRVQEQYDVELEYELAPVREFDDPAVMEGVWEDGTALHGMPVDSSLWTAQSPPTSTELLNSAVIAAARQGEQEAFLRRLWMHGIAAGQDMNEKSALVNLADLVGLDVAQFTEDVETVEVETASSQPQVPVTEVPIKGYTQTWQGYVQYVDFKQQFIFEGREEQPPGPVSDFVREHGPVATEEIMEVYQWDRERAVGELQSFPEIERQTIGRGEFWG
jgi:predicted DsbA family dithiol-disulfide isomerase